MMTKRNDNLVFPTDREAFLAQAVGEDDGCVSVGGLAVRLGMLKVDPMEAAHPRVFARLVEFARRAGGMTVEKLAKRADIELEDLVSIETDDEFIPAPRTVYRLAEALKLPVPKLLELARLAERRDEQLAEAAVRFAARSEPCGKLTHDERDAFEEFVKVLAKESAKE